MTSSDEPRVAVVTPVLNGEPYIDEAIQSIRAQCYRNWVYIILDNCSSDNTREIVRHHAAEDPRIQLVSNDKTLPLMQNWNAALRHVPADAAYCKVLHADDWLAPHCLAAMVGLAERHRGVGIVSSVVQVGRDKQGMELASDQAVFDGHEICRDVLLGRYYPFGSPSALLIRADIVRARAKAGFYNVRNVHADLEVCYDILRTHAFGYIGEILSYRRLHEGSMTNTFATRYSTHIVEYLGMLWRYGPIYLDDETYKAEASNRLRHYRRTFARRLVAGRGIGYWRFHKVKLAGYGYDLSVGDVVVGLLDESAQLIMNPRYLARIFPSLFTQPRVRSELPKEV